MILLTLFFYYNCFEALIFSLLAPTCNFAVKALWHCSQWSLAHGMLFARSIGSKFFEFVAVIVMFSSNITSRCNSYCCTMYLDAMLLLYQDPVALVAIRGAIDMLFSNLQLLGASALLPICIPTKISIYSGTISKLFQASLSAQYGSG